MQIQNGYSGQNISSNDFSWSGTHVQLAAPALSTRSLDNESAATPTVDVKQYVFLQNPDLLQSAKTTAQLIESAQVLDVHGVHRLSEPDSAVKSVTISAASRTYRRISDTVLFFIQLAYATGDARYLKSAAKGADYLTATWQNLVDRPSEDLLSDRSLNLSFCGGLAGVAYVLNETSKATGNEKFRRGARSITDYIVQAAKSVGSGFAWSEAPGITGDGSIVLYLLYAAREFGSPLYGVTAERAADHILEIANNERHGGFSWSGFPAFPGLPKDAYLPTFEDGTAGITYVFARIYSETNKARFLFAAKQGALHLESTATSESNAALISHPLSDLPDSQYSVFCHGPAGTARTFFELYKITREPKYQVRAERLAQTILQKSFPENLAHDYNNTVCQSCGSVSVIDLYIEMWASTGRLDYLASAQRAARQLVSRELDLDGKGSQKPPVWTLAKPWKICAEGGYDAGEAGIGSALLHVHLAEQGRYNAILRLDSPFTHIRHAKSF